MGLKLFSRRWNDPKATTAIRGPEPIVEHYEPAEAFTFEDDQLQRFLQLERYAHILQHRHTWESHPQLASVCQAAVQAIDEHFALVPEGIATCQQGLSEEHSGPDVTVETEPFLLARHAVTHEQYQKFVDGGGYEDLNFWPKDIWPHLIDFRDLTCEAGPRYWKNGRHHRRLAKHPVVGICYYEAAAYAKWAGLRLPTEEEWQMAASWRIRSSADVLRRYPWGDALDVQRCNIWASALGETAPVDAYDAGSAPNGILQLIGNVWEWTWSDFALLHDNGQPIAGPMPFKSIRGGAFDTYFACQATSLFRTGLATLSRVHNVGFRCALDLNVPADPATPTGSAEARKPATGAEVKQGE